MSDEVGNDEVSEESVFGFATGQAKYAMAYVTQCMKTISRYGYKVTREADSIANPFVKVNDSDSKFSAGEMAWMDYLDDKPSAHNSRKNKKKNSKQWPRGISEQSKLENASCT